MKYYIIIGMTDNNYQPSLSGIRAFVAIAEYQHFGLAAQKLEVTQPTLSQSLAALEQGLQVQLVNRSTRRVEITDTGKLLLAKANNIIAGVDSLLTDAKHAVKTANNVIRIGIIPTVAPYLIPDLLQWTNTNNSFILHLIEDKTEILLDQLKNGNLDVAILAIPVAGDNFSELPLYKENFYIVTPVKHPLAYKADITITTLKKQPIVLLTEGHCLRNQIVDLCRLNDTQPQFLPTKATSLKTAIQCVAGGIGLTFIPAGAINTEINTKKLALATFASPAPSRTIGLVYKTATIRSKQFEQLAQIIRKIKIAKPNLGVQVILPSEN